MAATVVLKRANRKGSRSNPSAGGVGPFNLSGGLTISVGNILTVVDDLLKNDGQKFLEMMEQFAESRMQRAVAASSSNNSEDEDDSDEEEYIDDEEEGNDNDEEEKAEGKRMFSIFAARMFEQHVLQAYREKVAKERQRQLLLEFEEEDQLRRARELKKRKENVKKREKKKAQKQAKESEKANRAAAKATEENLTLAPQIAEVCREKAAEERQKQLLQKLEEPNQACVGKKPTTVVKTKSNTNTNSKIWSASALDDPEGIREFWLGLGEEKRRNLVKIEKHAVLRKMKELQKYSCRCVVCIRKRLAMEEELEVLYDAYYEELEQYADHQQRYISSGGTIPPPPGPGPFPGSVEVDQDGNVVSHPSPFTAPREDEAANGQQHAQAQQQQGERPANAGSSYPQYENYDIDDGDNGNSLSDTRPLDTNRISVRVVKGNIVAGNGVQVNGDISSPMTLILIGVAQSTDYMSQLVGMSTNHDRCANQFPSSSICVPRLDLEPAHSYLFAGFITLGCKRNATLSACIIALSLTGPTVPFLPIEFGILNFVSLVFLVAINLRYLGFL